MALVVEPSFHHLVWTLPGVLYAKVTAFGESMYMPFINRAKREKEGTNCITNMVKMLEAIEEWASEYEERNKYESPGGTVTAKVNIGAIEGGQSYAPNFSMFSCSAYVDIRILPTRDLNDVKREFKQVLEKTSIDFRMEFYRSHKGYEGRNTQPLADGIRAAYRQVFNAEPPQDGSGANMWNDVNIFHEMGIPAVKFGIGSVAPMTLSLNKAGSEGVKIDEYVNMAKIYALTAINICSFDG
jgi:acetylornithine deacetylase/succinyl-diaminopimelate desuccinylase-like protein